MPPHHPRPDYISYTRPQAAVFRHQRTVRRPGHLTVHFRLHRESQVSMLHLMFAPSADYLAAQILPLLRRVWRDDPLNAPAVIVPSPAFGTWLRMRLARGMGEPDGVEGLHCVANLELPTIEHYLWQVLAADPDMRLLDATRLQQVVCALLEPALIAQPVYAPLRAYLEQGGSTDPLKRVQLAARVAALFLEYEYNRPSVWGNGRWRRLGVDASWLNGVPYFGRDTPGEEWQRHLYCQAITCLRQPGMTEWGRQVRYISLPHLYRLRREHGLPDGSVWRPPPGYVFLVGVSKVSHFHRNLLVEISQHDAVEMYVFLTNPCAEFWEDVDTRRSRSLRRAWRHDSSGETAGIRPRRPEDYDKQELVEVAVLPPDHTLLELWGTAGKENIFLWCQDAQWNFEYHHPEWAESENPPSTLLKALQYSLLRREPALRACARGWKPDGTLQVLACPDRGREMEEIREQILDLVAAGALATLNEAAVYMPDPAVYLPHIQRVFGCYRPDDPAYIPFCVLGAPGGDSAFAQGVLTLLALLQGQFDRVHMFELLRNPLVQATRRFAAGAVGIWEQWAAQLGIYRGYNRTHRAELGDQGDSRTDAHTFELGMARMLVGDLAAGPTDLGFVLGESSETDGKRWSLPVYPYRDFATSDRQLLEQFCKAVEDLHTGVRHVRSALEEGLAAALEVFADLVREWLGEIPDETVADPSAEAGVQREFFAALPLIALQTAAAGRQTGVTLVEFVALTAACLPAELPLRGQAWTGGITFAPLRPSMIVPHRVIFAAGLDAAAFPGTSDRPTWDLLSQKRIVGDSDRVRDNRFVFLELLHAARERLVLSFQSRDMQKEVDLEPSSVVLELETFLKGQGLIAADQDGRKYCTVRRTVPWIVHESLAACAAAGRPHGSWDRSAHDLAVLAAGPRCGHRHELAPRTNVPAATESLPPLTLRTTLHDLRLFFANPLEYHIRRTLGIELEEDPETLSATDEPLESDQPALSSLQKVVWVEVLGRVFGATAGEAAIDPTVLAAAAQRAMRREYAAHNARGGAPEALLGTMEESALVQWAAACVTPAIQLAAAFPAHNLLENTDLSLGRPGVAGELSVELPDGRRCMVACRHALVLTPKWGADDNTIGIVAIKKEGEADGNPDLWLAGVLQWLAESEHARPAVRLVQLNRGTAKSPPALAIATFTSDTTHAQRIRAWLGALLDEMLTARCSDHLPFAAVQKVYEDGQWGHVSGETIAEVLEGEHAAYRSFARALELADARLPEVSDKELQERARRRFAPMLEKLLSDRHND